MTTLSNDFEIDEKTQDKVNDWLTTIVYPEVISYQKEHMKNDLSSEMCWEAGLPYEGAIGGGLSYEFTPTGLGNIIVVKYSSQNKKYSLDVTDYDNW